jgi:hypothetical protein
MPGKPHNMIYPISPCHLGRFIGTAVINDQYFNLVKAINTSWQLREGFG